MQANPEAELVGGGNNAKYARDCMELFLGGKGTLLLGMVVELRASVRVSVCACVKIGS